MPTVSKPPPMAGRPISGSSKLGLSAPASKIGMASINREIAQAPEPQPQAGAGENTTAVDTFFTTVPSPGRLSTDIIYNGDRQWAKITLTLETSGPVAVGNLAAITPVLSGKGQLLEPGVPTVFFIAKGTRLYAAASGLNRVKRVVEPVPWLEAVTGLLTMVAKK